MSHGLGASSHDRVIVWFRRDLRLHDHPALSQAVAHARSVVPLFVADPVLLQGRVRSEVRNWFLGRSLEALDASLRGLGSRLVVLHGRPADVIPRVAHEVGASSVLVSREPSPYGSRRDRAVAAALEAEGRSFLALPGTTLVDPDELLTAAGSPYLVFSPFWRILCTLPRRSPLPAPRSLPGLPFGWQPDASRQNGPILPEPLALRHPPARHLPTPGEHAARARLAAWVREGLEDYAQGRDDLSGAGSSRLGQDLHLGLLSVTEVEAVCGSGSASAQAFRRQLGWREFYWHLLHHRPEFLDRPVNERLARALRPEEAEPEAVAAWREGRTGVPVVDAAMRQLAATGWLSNRARLVTASFLTRHLLIDQRVGEAHFMRHLVDGDVASNSGGWQWTAGVGTDAQPWFRIFNPVLQGQRFDPQGEWVRHWVPELSGVPDRHIHAPWLWWEQDARSRSAVGRYPSPMVDLAWARERALAAFRAAARD